MVEILKVTGVSFLLACLSMPLWRALAFRFDIVDRPKDDRRMHKQDMPFLGGAAIFLGTMVSILCFGELNRSVVGIVLGGTMVFILGLLDDIYDLDRRLKFGVELLIAAIVFYFGVRIEFIANPFSSEGHLIYLGIAAFPLTALWIVGVTNALNLIDGLDGLSGGVAAISALTLAIIANRFGYGNAVVISLSIVGGCLGFLMWNFHPAKIFMGDAGALFLGFLLASISVDGVMKSVTAIALLVPILGLSVPIFDTAFAIVRRLRKGQSIGSADKGHLHHRLLKKGFSHRLTVLILYAISALYGGIAILLTYLNSRYSVFIALGLLLLTVFVATFSGILKQEE